jgi:hypothetical protein
MELEAVRFPPSPDTGQVRTPTPAKVHPSQPVVSDRATVPTRFVVSSAAPNAMRMRPDLVVDLDDVAGRRVSSSPDAVGVARNLPGPVAGAARHSVVVPTHAGLDLQEDLEQGGIGLGNVFALPEVACGPRVARVEPTAVVDDRLAD